MPRTTSPWKGKPLTQMRLKEVLRYDPETGDFFWVKTNRAARLIGERAGYVCATFGYVMINLAGGMHRAHRLAWLYMTGEWPEFQIDHRDLDKANNRWSNLRAATSRQNGFNRRAQSNNRTGLKGVTLKRPGQWFARCSNEYIGAFDCPAAAHFAYIITASRTAGEFARFS